MALSRKRFSAAIMTLSCGLLAACSISFPSVDFVPFPQEETSLRSAEKTRIELTAFLTGWVEAPADILIDQSAPDLPEDLRIPQWVPSVAYVAHHPDHGSVILDAGLRAGACDYGLRPIYWVPCKNKRDSDLVSQLKASKRSHDAIRYIVPSHFHGDHVSGLRDLIAYADVPVLMTEQGRKELKSPFRAFAGIPSTMIKGGFKVSVMNDFWQDTDPLGRTLDIFGDQSLLLVQTGGHTDGHLSAFVRTEDGPVLLTFDAAHLRANLLLMTPSGAVTSLTDANASLEMINDAQARNPNLKVIFGHEPTQWDCITELVEVSVPVSIC